MRVKIVTFLFLAIICTSLLFAQEEEERQGGFKKEKIFIGSALSLAVTGDVFQIGATPEIGYSLTKWLDAGITFNINYSSYRYPYFTDQYLNYGVGSMVRIWPINFLFISAIPEYNWIDITRKYVDNNIPSQKDKFNAGSLLVGAGYGSRVVGQAYSYFALMFDALNNKYSPYRDAQGRAIPIIRAGFAIYLGSSKNR
jgi:hypothetical protein